MEGKNVVIGFLVIALLFFGYQQYGTPAAIPPATPATPGVTAPTAAGQIICPTDPQVQLGANKKEDSGQTNWGNWKYKLNGGATQTDADGTFTVVNQVPNDYLIVLVADANSSANYRYLWNPTIDVCGINPKAYNDVIPFKSFETKCFNENGDPINGTTYSNANLSIGSGGSRTVKCELTGVAKTGLPDVDGDGIGGVLFLELNSTTYKEGTSDLTVSWDGVQLSRADDYGAYKLSAATGSAEEFKIPTFYGAVTKTFYITLSAETNVDPALGGNSITDYGDGVTGYIIPENCYEEEDVSPSIFKCGMQDLDGTFTSPGGTVKSSAAVTQFWIPVR